MFQEIFFASNIKQILECSHYHLSSNKTKLRQHENAIANHKPGSRVRHLFFIIRIKAGFTGENETPL